MEGEPMVLSPLLAAGMLLSSYKPKDNNTHDCIGIKQLKRMELYDADWDYLFEIRLKSKDTGLTELVFNNKNTLLYDVALSYSNGHPEELFLYNYCERYGISASACYIGSHLRQIIIPHLGGFDVYYGSENIISKLTPSNGCTSFTWREGGRVRTGNADHTGLRPDRNERNVPLNELLILFIGCWKYPWGSVEHVFNNNAMSVHLDYTYSSNWPSQCAFVDSSGGTMMTVHFEYTHGSIQ